MAFPGDRSLKILDSGAMMKLMEMLAIPIPEDLLKSANMDKNAMIEIIRYDLAGRLFREGKISLEQGAELCGMNIYEFLDILAVAGIPVINYPAEELEEEIASLLQQA
jgi:predicted HTH domain antitoxin